MSSLTHTRLQFPVGQGLFHGARLALDASNRQFNYVYDCGSVGPYAAVRGQCIEDYRGWLGAEPLDILFVSHAHDDHINGLKALLRGLDVKTIILPLLSPTERLIAWARSVEADEAAGNDPDYQAWIIDPLSALAAYGPDRILQIGPGAPLDGDQPNDGPRWDGDPLPDDFQPVDDQVDVESSNDTLPGPDGRDWDFVGRGNVTRTEVDGTPVFEVDDTIGIRPRGAESVVPWVLAMHVAPATQQKVDAFRRALAGQFRCPQAWLDDWMSHNDGTGIVRGLLEHHPAELRRAYRSVVGDINLTSLSVYSGPVVLPSGVGVTGTSWRSHGPHRALDPGMTGWLGTGDAALATRFADNLDAFLLHYRSVAQSVRTMTLPHHGSRYSFSDRLLSELQPECCVATAAPHRNWNHPHAEVVREVEYAGIELVNVSADERSGYGEQFVFTP